QEQAQPQGRDNRSGANANANDNRPGGGLGAPIDAPDALQQYRWPILGGFALLLAIGGWIVTKRQTSPAVAAASASPVVPNTLATTSRPAPPSAVPSSPAAKPSMLLEALKEELFQLEVERKQGKITPADYEKAKAALDQTLERALKRQG